MPDRNGFTLRPAVPADLPDIVRLVRGLAVYEKLEQDFTATWADFEVLLFAPDHVADAIIAEIPGLPPMGIALYHRTVNTFRGRIGLFLEDLFVEPAHRGTGIGRALLRHLAGIAVARGYNNVAWSVLNWNEPSIRFYESIGATKITEWHSRLLRGPALTAFAEGATSHG